MQIILTDDVAGLGDIGETVSVRPGFARNFLIPRGFAIEAQTASARSIAHKMRQIEAKKRRLKIAADERAKEIQSIVLEFGLRVGSGGRVFGSISSRQVAEKLAEHGIEIDRRRVLLPEPIKRVGSRKVRVKLHADVIAEIEVLVTSLAATAAEEATETHSARHSMEQAAAIRDAETEQTPADDADLDESDVDDTADEE